MNEQEIEVWYHSITSLIKQASQERMELKKQLKVNEQKRERVLSRHRGVIGDGRDLLSISPITIENKRRLKSQLIQIEDDISLYFSYYFELYKWYPVNLIKLEYTERG